MMSTFSHILELDYNKYPQLELLFKSIATGNTILFLGAGASVTGEKRFLSQDLIDFYEDKKLISWGIKDITEFVDALSHNLNYSRDEFDNYVDECLRRLQLTNAHLTIAKTLWRLIITTNYDLLIEKAFAKVEGTSEEQGKIKVVHTIEQFHGIQARNEIKYVKLNGCLSDKKTYRLVFSTEDFATATKFYKPVLNDLKNLSDNVTFLSVGYSYSDDFAKKLLNKIDSFNFRERRLIYNVDPFVNESMLPTYQSKQICIIKCSMEQFFTKYDQWREEKDIIIRSSNKGNFTNHRDTDLFIPTHISRRVGDNLKQLNSFYRSRIIGESEFYKGGEPDYNIILKHYDVIKQSKIEETIAYILKKTNDNETNSRLIPLFFLTGTFGTGKSTFAYRLLNKLNQSESPTISFEIVDPSELSAIDLREIFQKSNAEYIFLYVNTIEINSVFKSLLELRNKLSIEASAESKIIFITTIRENILSKFKDDKQIKNSFEINIDCPFIDTEIEELVEKLKASGIVKYSDIKEKKAIVNKIQRDFSGDSFVSLLELVQGNKLIEDLLQAYYQLNDKCQKAFIYTSLLYQYKILMPSGLLRSLVSSDWNTFRADVIERDGKGILIQEIKDSKGTDPDLYFRTKHSVISRRLINNLLSDEDSRYTYIKSIVTHVITGTKNSKLIIDLFKAISGNKDFSYSKIDTLFDLADEHLGEDPYFLLHYAINLQKRQTESFILKAISKIEYAESISEHPQRNHYLIHRSGVLNFELAKIIFGRRKEGTFYKVLHYISIARDFLEIKRAYDPFSTFSYFDLIALEIWCLEKFEEGSNEKLKRRIRIEELFDTAFRTVFENLGKIHDLKSKYIQNHKFGENEKSYLEFLHEYFENPTTRPYALVLIFNYYFSREEYNKCEEYLAELEAISLNNDALKVLFKYYGRKLNSPLIREKFFGLIKTNPELEDSENLRFNYFSFVAECYNKNFGYAHKYLTNIREKFNHINPDLHQVWSDHATGKAILFEAVLKVNKRGKRQFYIPDLNLWARSENWGKTWEINMQFDVEIHFYVYGIRAKAINIITDEFEDDDLPTQEEIEL